MYGNGHASRVWKGDSQAYLSTGGPFFVRFASGTPVCIVRAKILDPYIQKYAADLISSPFLAYEHSRRESLVGNDLRSERQSASSETKIQILTYKKVCCGLNFHLFLAYEHSGRESLVEG